MRRAKWRGEALKERADLGASKVDELEPQSGGVDEQIVGLQVTVTDAAGVYVLEGLQRLIQVDAHVVDRKTLPLLLELQGHRADRLRQKVHHQV
jgi:hypothetical protein